MFEIFDKHSTSVSVQSAYLATKRLAHEGRAGKVDDSVQHVSSIILESIEEVEGKKINNLSIERSKHYIIEIEKHIATLIRNRSGFDEERGRRLMTGIFETEGTMYKIKTTEWELTEEEQEKADFILKFSERINTLAAKGTPIATLEIGAYRYFKDTFYAVVARRLNIPLAGKFPFNPPDAYASIDISDDGKRVTGYRVEKA